MKPRSLIGSGFFFSINIGQDEHTFDYKAFICFNIPFIARHAFNGTERTEMRYIGFFLRVIVVAPKYFKPYTHKRSAFLDRIMYFLAVNN